MPIRPLKYLSGVLLTLAAGLMVTSSGAAEQVVPSSRQQVTLTFAPVVKQAAPAVVNIYTRKVVQNQVPPMFNDPFFRRFFGDQLRGRDRVQNSLGSGVIVRSTGVVITNSHVASDADQINIVLSDRREYAAKLVGKDDRSDLAVLQLQGVTEALPALELSESDNVEVGDLVLAIGNPFGVGQTVTSGIVSALARTTVNVSDFRSFIQTDAAINPGNSGGALITSDGRLIGINTAIYSGNGGSVGIGFAIPSNMVRSVLVSILKEGKAVRPWLGASGKSITSELAKSLALPRPTGVIVDRVVAGSPADKAGLSVGDIVRTVNGHEVNDIEELRYRFATMPVGGKASVETLRNGTPRTLSMALQPPPEVPPRKTIQMFGPAPFSGSIVANLNPALAEELGREYQEPGVVIMQIAGGTPAAGLGIQSGDMVLAINDRPIKSVDDMIAATAKPQPVWIFSILRDGQAYTFQVGG
ncbi:MAG: Do family serine endopeptidase [Rhodospirillaceae bacterium]|nr:Do family serine endopeptidase [Rhodospirillaceae bacterium]